MVYVAVRHDKKAQRDASAQAGRGSDTRAVFDGQSRASGAPEKREVMSNVDCTIAQSMPSEVRVSRRRSRRPTTSTLSDKVWREMRKQIVGRAQDDGVT